MSITRSRAHVVSRQWMLSPYEMIQFSPGGLCEERCPPLVTYGDHGKGKTKDFGTIKCKFVQFSNVSYVKGLKLISLQLVYCVMLITRFILISMKERLLTPIMLLLYQQNVVVTFTPWTCFSMIILLGAASSFVHNLI